MIVDVKSPQAIHNCKRCLLRRAASLGELLCRFVTMPKHHGRLDDLGDHMLRDIGQDGYQREEDRIASAIQLTTGPTKHRHLSCKGSSRLC
ncbi:hypothetical protein GCM10010520_55650 [Rhizobium viscosum]|uniref:Uncharacterized protein n=1 Tax=Rhizobium viscosum TaxID=1673 RepID=A0ABR9IZL0_RHIVS|nr:hypothetical protein [Rhizobium viscosum]MBE1508634.1 hypothetical protein [Rhizobium viscosum]